MDITAAIALSVTVIETLIKVAPLAVQAIGDLKVFAVTLFERFTGQTITDEQRVELEASIDALHNEFQQPIPAESDQ